MESGPFIHTGQVPVHKKTLAYGSYLGANLFLSVGTCSTSRGSPITKESNVIVSYSFHSSRSASAIGAVVLTLVTV